LYALRRSAGPYPAGTAAGVAVLAFGATLGGAGSTWRTAWHVSRGPLSGHARSTRRVAPCDPGEAGEPADLAGAVAGPGVGAGSAVGVRAVVPSAACPGAGAVTGAAADAELTGTPRLRPNTAAMASTENRRRIRATFRHGVAEDRDNPILREDFALVCHGSKRSTSGRHPALAQFTAISATFRPHSPPLPPSTGNLCDLSTAFAPAQPASAKLRDLPTTSAASTATATAYLGEPPRTPALTSVGPVGSSMGRRTVVLGL